MLDERVLLFLRRPVLKEFQQIDDIYGMIYHIFMADGVVSDDRFHCILNYRKVETILL